MFAISQFLLSMYDESQHLSPAVFVNNSLGRLQKLLKFDSAGILSFAFSEVGNMRIASAFPFNLTDVEKLEAQMDFNLPGICIPGRGLVGADPLLIKCFDDKYKSHSSDSIPTQRLPECGVRTQRLHTMVMVVDDHKFGGYNSAALWRSKSASNYSQSEMDLSDVVTPHFFSALRVNRALSEAPCAVGTQMEPVICSINGMIHFVDSEVFKLFESEWTDWKPPRLPSKVFEELRSNGSMSYIGKCLTIKGRAFEDLLILSVTAKANETSLTKMEFRVAALLGQGASYKEIALQLGTSPATVRNQVHSIYVKLRVSRKSSVGPALIKQGHRA